MTPFHFSDFFHPNVYVMAFLYNIFDLNICGLVSTYIDIYFRYMQFKFTYPKRNSWDRILIFGYGITTLMLTWSPFYTIVPFFVDVNAPAVLALFNVGNLVYFSSYLAFNTFFTIIFLRSLNIARNYENRRLRMLAAKSIIHGLLRYPQQPAATTLLAELN